LKLNEPIKATRVKVRVDDGFNTAEDIAESTKAKGKIHENMDYAEFVGFYATSDEQVLDPNELWSTKTPKPPAPPEPPIEDEELIDLLINIIGAVIVVGLIIFAVTSMKKGGEQK
jgi:hypothetical protein